MTNEWLNTTYRHTASPGFWWYISSHLYGTAGPGSATPKTPAQSPMSMPVPVAAVPMPMHVSSTATASTAVAEPALAAAVASAAAPASSPYAGDVRTSSSSTANSEPTGGLTAAKTLNRFLRGKFPGPRYQTRLCEPSHPASEIRCPTSWQLAHPNGFVHLFSVSIRLTQYSQYYTSTRPHIVAFATFLRLTITSVTSVPSIPVYIPRSFRSRVIPRRPLSMPMAVADG